MVKGHRLCSEKLFKKTTFSVISTWLRHRHVELSKAGVYCEADVKKRLVLLISARRRRRWWCEVHRTCEREPRGNNRMGSDDSSLGLSRLQPTAILLNICSSESLCDCPFHIRRYEHLNYPQNKPERRKESQPPDLNISSFNVSSGHSKSQTAAQSLPGFDICLPPARKAVLSGRMTALVQQALFCAFLTGNLSQLRECNWLFSEPRSISRTRYACRLSHSRSAHVHFTMIYHSEYV